MEYETVLKTCALFRDFSDEELSAAEKFFDARIKTYEKGEILQLAGSEMTRFGLLLDGTVQVYMDDINGNRMIMANVRPGVTFGEALCWLRVPEIPVCITAAADSTVMWLSAENLRFSQNGSLEQELRSRFISILARRTLSMNDRIQILSKSSIRAKLFTFFSQCHSENGDITFYVNLDRQDMAAYLGTDRSALSRELSRMKSEGLIDYRKNRFTILKPMEEE